MNLGFFLKQTLMCSAAFEIMGSLQTFAAFARQKKRVDVPSVRFLQVAQFSLRAQRMSAIRLSRRNVHGAAI
jgi:hypothetical protein